MTAVGERVPPLALPDSEGATHELQPRAASEPALSGGTGPATASEPAVATVLVFTCNHCPYALAWHQRIIDVARDYAPRGVRVLAINPNDAERYPRDSLEAMRARVQAGEFEGVPYLHDASQRTARAYDARTTPDVYVVDRDGVLRYRGAPDADHDDPAQDAAWLRAALDAVLAARAPEPAETTPVGCSIKWLAPAPG